MVTEVTATLLKGGLEPPERTVFRGFGTAMVASEEGSWSAIAKFPPAVKPDRDPIQREVFLYEGDVLKSLTGPMAVPECYVISRDGVDEPWNWLEEIHGTTLANATLTVWRMRCAHSAKCRGLDSADPCRLRPTYCVSGTGFSRTLMGPVAGRKSVWTRLGRTPRSGKQ